MSSHEENLGKYQERKTRSSKSSLELIMGGRVNKQKWVSRETSMLKVQKYEIPGRV